MKIEIIAKNLRSQEKLETCLKAIENVTGIKLKTLKEGDTLVLSVEEGVRAFYTFPESYFDQGEIAVRVTLKDIAAKIFGLTVDPRKLSGEYARLQRENDRTEAIKPVLTDKMTDARMSKIGGFKPLFRDSSQ